MYCIDVQVLYLFAFIFASRLNFLHFQKERAWKFKKYVESVVLNHPTILFGSGEKYGKELMESILVNFFFQ